jgi:hypothetical protein
VLTARPKEGQNKKHKKKERKKGPTIIAEEGEKG